MTFQKIGRVFDGFDELFDWLTDPRNVCSHCKKALGRDHNYCVWCGEKNENFDEEEFIRRNELTLREGMEAECTKDHPIGREMIQDNPAHPYCGHCGVNLLDPVRIN